MPIIPLTVQVLELNKRKGKKNDVIYNNLICYQAGAEYPEVLSINVPEEKLDDVHPLIGEVDQTIMVDFFHNKFGARYKFIKAA